MSWGEGTMSWAELRDLVEALPQDSATKAAMAGDVNSRRWRDSDYGIAAVYNALLILIRISWKAHLMGSPPELKPIDAPTLEEDEAAAEARRAKAARNEAFLERMAPAQGRSAEQEAAEAAEWQAKIRALETAQKQ